jgi:flagellar hook-basal body complex protein FliE
MTMSINLDPTLRPIQAPEAPRASELGPASGGDAAEAFSDALLGALGRASSAEKTADEAAQRFAAGDSEMGIHEVMIAAEKATIAVRFAVTLKNKAIEAYRELMNTQI